MLPEVKLLLIVQDRDQKIHKLKQVLEKIPRDKNSAQNKLLEDKQAVDAAKRAYQDNQVATKNIELDIATRRDTIAKLKAQQFETKKNDEYTALGNDVSRYEQMVDDLETSELELMETADELNAAYQSAINALQETQHVVDQEIKDLDTKAAESKTRLDEVVIERKKLASDVEGSLMELYDRLLIAKGIDPVVPLSGMQCTGCHMKVTRTTMVNTQAEKNITQCENCGRILYCK